MKTLSCLSGAILCMCGIVAAQESAQIPVLDREKAIHLPGICRPEGIQVFGYWKSRQNPQITVYSGSSPLTGASVEIYSGVGSHGELLNSKPILVLVSDANGRVVLPWLHSGKYYIVGRSKPNREDDFYLEISSFGRKWKELDLHVHPVRGSAEWVFESFGTTDRVNQVSTFSGIVEDFEGPVPNAEIDVFARKLGIDQQQIELRSDSDGKFSANLPEGQYAVHIQKGGWETLFQIDISQRGTSAGLHVGLCPIDTE